MKEFFTSGMVLESLEEIQELYPEPDKFAGHGDGASTVDENLDGLVDPLMASCLITIVDLVSKDDLAADSENQIPDFIEKLDRSMSLFRARLPGNRNLAWQFRAICGFIMWVQLHFWIGDAVC